MKRPLLLTVALSAAVLGTAHLAGQAPNCRDCQPSIFNYSNPSGDFRIGFEPGMFSQTEQSALLYGAQYWNLQNSNGPFVQNAPASYSQADIAFFVDYDLAGTAIVAQAHLGSDGRGMIGVNPDRLNDARSHDFWSWVGAHEVGHMFDFKDVYVSGCAGMSVMFGTVSSNPGSLPSNLCSDRAASSDKYGLPPGGSYCDFGCPPGYTTNCVGDQQPDPNNCDCCINYTPILIDLHGNGIRMTSAEHGAVFSINTCGSVLRVAWPDSIDDVWLALDRNRNGFIDNGSELFGNATPLSGGGFAENGFLSLADWDENADNWLDAQDSVFQQLVVWSDANRNGASEPGELSPLERKGIEAIGTTYRETRYRDAWGNQFRFVGQVRTRAGRRLSVDVIPVTMNVSSP